MHMTMHMTIQYSSCEDTDEYQDKLEEHESVETDEYEDFGIKSDYFPCGQHKLAHYSAQADENCHSFLTSIYPQSSNRKHAELNNIINLGAPLVSELPSDSKQRKLSCCMRLSKSSRNSMAMNTNSHRIPWSYGKEHLRKKSSHIRKNRRRFLHGKLFSPPTTPTHSYQGR